MIDKLLDKLPAKAHDLKKLLVLIAAFVLILFTILIIRCFLNGESDYVDSVAGDIQQEMEGNQLVLSAKGGRRTIADFKDPILLKHGGESRLIVYSAELAETVSLIDEGWFGIKWTSTYKEVQYTGLAEYTVDLSQLSDKDFTVNNELKTLTVRIPYTVLSPITIIEGKTQFYDAQYGWLAPKDVKLTAEEHSQVMIQVKEKFKAHLIDENIITKANEEAKAVVQALLTTTVQAIDPEFTVVVVQ